MKTKRVVSKESVTSFDTVKHTKNGNKHTLTFNRECDACKGTGLYVGFAEHDGAAVVCRQCDGKGMYEDTVNFTEATTRKQRRGIVRVYQVNCGYSIGVGNGCTLEQFGGMPYKEWEAGLPFPKGSEMRKYVCPSWWAQTAGDKKPDWKECIFCGAFRDCKLFPSKDACWARWDKEKA